MGSSSGDDYSTPPQQPAPPGNLISPMGTATPYQPNFINFLGNTNTPSTGLTPQMLQQIMASNGPPPGPPVSGGGGMPVQTAPAVDPKKELLARLMSQAQEAQRNDPTGRAGRIIRPDTSPQYMGVGGANAR